MTEDTNPLSGLTTEQEQSALGTSWDKFLEWRQQNLEATASGANPLMPGALGGIIAGERGAMNLFRAGNTKPINDLMKAKQLAQSGTHELDIWDKTGWYQGADGKWRFEIGDEKAKFDPHAAREAVIEHAQMFEGDEISHADLEKSGYYLPPQAILDHPELYKAYPELNDLTVQMAPRSGKGSMPDTLEGAYYEGQGIKINPNAAVGDKGKSIMLHETQHGVQRLEGFARGGSSEGIEQQVTDAVTKKYEKLKVVSPTAAENYLNSVARQLPANVDWGDIGYRGLAGEVEARNVQSRMDMHPSSRQQFPPFQTEELPRPIQIVLPNGRTATLTPIEHDPFHPENYQP